MKSSDLLRLVDQMHHEKQIKRDIIFDGIEAALQLAAQKHFGDESGVVVSINRDSGEISVVKGEERIDPTLLGRIPAQSAKQVMIQKIREAESNAVMSEYLKMKSELVTGAVQRHDGGACIVSLGKAESILPKSEQIPGETHHINDRVKAIVLDVKKVGQRVKIILSRTHPDFVRQLFENEIPEIADRTIEIKALAREAGYRTKIAVSSIDMKVDCVGACVGVRGSRIKNIVDELGGERIDIVRWNDSLQVMIPNALQPAQIEEVFLYPRPGRAIVLVKEDQLSLAIGRRGQNVRLASKLVGWDIEIMTHDELNESIGKAEGFFREIPNIADGVVETLIEEGLLSYDDVSFLDPAELVEMAGVTEDEAEDIIQYAEEASARLEEDKAYARDNPEPEADPAATEEQVSPAVLEGDAAVQNSTAEEPVDGSDNGLAAPEAVGDAETQPDDSSEAASETPTADSDAAEHAVEAQPGDGEALGQPQHLA